MCVFLYYTVTHSVDCSGPWCKYSAGNSVPLTYFYWDPLSHVTGLFNPLSDTRHRAVDLSGFYGFRVAYHKTSTGMNPWWSHLKGKYYS